MNPPKETFTIYILMFTTGNLLCYQILLWPNWSSSSQPCFYYRFCVYWIIYGHWHKKWPPSSGCHLSGFIKSPFLICKYLLLDTNMVSSKMFLDSCTCYCHKWNCRIWWLEMGRSGENRKKSRYESARNLTFDIL